MTGDIRLTDMLRLQRQVGQVKSQATNKRNKYFQHAQAELGKAQEDLAGVQQNMALRKSQPERTELRAPCTASSKCAHHHLGRRDPPR